MTPARRFLQKLMAAALGLVVAAGLSVAPPTAPGAHAAIAALASQSDAHPHAHDNDAAPVPASADAAGHDHGHGLGEHGHEPGAPALWRPTIPAPGASAARPRAGRRRTGLPPPARDRPPRRRRPV